MTGDETDGTATATRTDGGRDPSDDRDEGRDHDRPEDDSGFVFGEDDGAGDEPRDEPTQTTSDDDRRIRVDLQSSDAGDTPASDSSDTQPSDSSTVRSEPPNRNPDRDLLASGPDPGPNAVRNWTVLLVGLSLTSLATAAFTYATQADPLPVVGAAALGLGFVALASVAQNTDVALLELLSAAWIEHRRYTWFATGLFAGGIVLGALALLAGINVLELLIEVAGENPFAELEDEEFELTASFFIVNNTGPFLLSIVGGLSLGLLTAFVMVFNGLIVGNVSAMVADLVGLEYIIVGLAPHGIFELAALFLAAAVGFRLIYRLAERVLDVREAFVTKSYAYRTLALVGFAWLLLVLAAFVEAYITPELLEMLVADDLEATPETTEMP
ncbi:stage II sporulation protein M [Salinadaptatus halalkaliphilus]|uniref:Stage II sporulation protein M n=1 Tax=Salinadaptatus halalkaliphilus TaxID=2419781 RepID=A0A4S3TN21_9EURY|nr:stage II sporulation protein M [Salinadaptatus halalkaliphilus]THE65679.1 stage II sporulation protein M [Salinadaptatus halalkaliphilus]